MKFNILSLLVAGALLVGCGEKSGPGAEPQKLQVLVSFLPLYAHAKSIAGDLADVRMLLDKNADPHDFEFKPSDVKKVAGADVFITNGVGLEEWLDDLLKNAANSGLRLVDASKGIELLDNPGEFFAAAGDEPEHEHEHGHAGDAAADEHHHHGEKNPHLWLDPVSARAQAENILAALVAADPKNADAYRRNAAAYFAELEKLDRDFRESMGRLTEKNLVTFHDAFPYLAKRYGFNYLGCIEEFPEQDPKPNDLKALVAAIREHRVKVIFAETGYSPKLLEEIARQSGATVAELDTLEIGEPAADAYLERMRANLAALAKAWRP
jgi:zinc/manganese transport system substrate-binding protein